MEWLADWIRTQVAENLARPVTLPGTGPPAAYLHGSIGYDTAITEAGEVWVSEYELDGPSAFEARWRLARPKERIGYLVIASRQHAELARLLPPKPVDSHSCARCNGMGGHTLRATDGTKVDPVPGMICEECAGLGWLAG